MADGEDLYWTIDAPAEAQFKERSSKFFAYAYPVSSPEEAMELVEGAGASGITRPPITAMPIVSVRTGACTGRTMTANPPERPGRPILGQMLSAGVTDCLIVVVRYFGGTKLGVPGLINAYRESAAGRLPQRKSWRKRWIQYSRSLPVCIV